MRCMWSVSMCRGEPGLTRRGIRLLRRRGMHGRQWARSVQACRREPEQGLRDGTTAGSAAAGAGPLRESGGYPSGREPAGVHWPLRVGGWSTGEPWGRGWVGQLAGGVGGRGAARAIDSTGAGGERQQRSRQARTSWGRDSGQMALNPGGPQALKSRRRLRS